ncbi:Dbl homology domain-containing protein [Hesseltinella vesiculosa]|uniref:Dbl homology domain-containing protein n=1 Tax=Hesseltinella vesiculosa TaxID=101127 RepID=A0A1X2G853_9FUNG|nr:Dbl homology domain-containing protein [Hesseltinella vesiculosa]
MNIEPERTFSSPLLLAKRKFGLAKSVKSSTKSTQQRWIPTSKSTNAVPMAANPPDKPWQRWCHNFSFLRQKKTAPPTPTTTLKLKKKADDAVIQIPAPPARPLHPPPQQRPISDYFFNHAQDTMIYQPTRNARPTDLPRQRPQSIIIEPGSPAYSGTSSRSSSIKTPRCHFDMGALDAKIQALDSSAADPLLRLPDTKHKRKLDRPSSTMVLPLDHAPMALPQAPASPCPSAKSSRTLLPIIRSFSYYFTPESPEKKQSSRQDRRFSHQDIRSLSPTMSAITADKPRRSYRQRLSSFDSPLSMPTRPDHLAYATKKIMRPDSHWQKEREAIKAWQLSIYLMLQQRVRIPSSVPKSVTSKDHATLRKFIINEIYTTELSYEQMLLRVKARYMTPMLAASQAKRPLVDAGDIPILFTHLPELIQVSKKVLKSVTPASADVPWYDQPICNLGQPWLRLKDDWSVFIKYALHYQTNIKSIRKSCNNFFLLKIDQECLSHNESKRLGISDYLISPIQRVPRYCLLLKDLLRHTPVTDLDYPALCQAVEMMSMLASAMNDTQQLYRRKTTTV